MNSSRTCAVLTTALVVVLVGVNSAMATNVDTAKSTLTVRVYKTGFFSAFAHDHEISAPIEQGTFSGDPAAVEIRVDARKLRVLDKDASDSEKAKIQKNMLGPEVLDSDKFTEIHFLSTSVSKSNGVWLVYGELTLHGQTHSVLVKVQKANGHYTGTAEVRQKDFGMTPISIAGGSVKVKNEVRIEFDIVGQ